jgi:hypothetical protein
VAKTATCIWCGEGINKTDATWRHNEAARIFCECHCAECDPENGYADGRDCIDGEPATPALLTVREEAGRD